MIFAVPALLVLAGFLGLVPADMNLLFVALPGLAATVLLALAVRASLRDLLLPRPVLSIDAEAIFDRRVMEKPLPWSEVLRATSLLEGRGGVVLDLRHPIPTAGMGSLLFETPDAGAAHIAIRGMTEPATALARAMLEFAAQAGAETGSAPTHDKVPRRRWSV